MKCSHWFAKRRKRVSPWLLVLYIYGPAKSRGTQGKEKRQKNNHQLDQKSATEIQRLQVHGDEARWKTVLERNIEWHSSIRSVTNLPNQTTLWKDSLENVCGNCEFIPVPGRQCGVQWFCWVSLGALNPALWCTPCGAEQEVWPLSATACH